MIGYAFFDKSSKNLSSVTLFTWERDLFFSSDVLFPVHVMHFHKCDTQWQVGTVILASSHSCPALKSVTVHRIYDPSSLKFRREPTAGPKKWVGYLAAFNLTPTSTTVLNLRVHRACIIWPHHSARCLSNHKNDLSVPSRSCIRFALPSTVITLHSRLPSWFASYLDIPIHDKQTNLQVMSRFSIGSN